MLYNIYTFQWVHKQLIVSLVIILFEIVKD